MDIYPSYVTSSTFSVFFSEARLIAASTFSRGKLYSTRIYMKTTKSHIPLAYDSAEINFGLKLGSFPPTVGLRTNLK